MPKNFTTKRLILILLFPLSCIAQSAIANEAADATINITAKTEGMTPFIYQFSLRASNVAVIKNISFAITPRPPSVTRPLTANYTTAYLQQRGDINSSTGEIFLPVWGLYANYTNTVTLTYNFLDGSAKQASTTVTTPAYSDPCGYENPAYLQHGTQVTDLSYDYVLIKNFCYSYSPVIIDTDGALRWQSPTMSNLASFTDGFFENAIYYAYSPYLFRLDLDGTFTFLADYTNLGVTDFHHNIDLGKYGLLLEANTTSYIESVIMEVDGSGHVLKTWNMANIISAAMIAGGDDPSQFVYPRPTDWFHNNSVVYNRADDSLIISSREDFVICIDYETNEIKWILGDPTKKWHEFPSLRKYALTVTPPSLPPIGQHSVSLTYDQNLMVFDNGDKSFFQQPPGAARPYASPRKYHLDLSAKTATEVWNYEMNQSIYSPICGSVYEDSPFNYLVDYAYVSENSAQLLGLDRAGEKVFYFQYPTYGCYTAFNSIPLHLESIKFPAIEPRAFNLSARGFVGTGDDSLIGGFIITGSDPKTVALRALGPSLGSRGVSPTVADPVLTLYDSSGAAIAANDNWQNDPQSSQLAADHLAPSNSAEAAVLRTLDPGSYTVVVRPANSQSGIGLVEAYDLSPSSNSRLANLSTRGYVGAGDEVLIGGFVVGEVDSNTVAIRALGPSLGAKGVANSLSDPVLTIYDTNGVALASNDNWQEDPNSSDIQRNKLAPSNPAEAATIVHLVAGAYTAVVDGKGGEGIALVEVYDL
jgi:hypothetical protein